MDPFPRRHTWFLDPRTKIGLMLAVSSIAMSGDITGIRIYPRLGLMLLPSILFMINRKIKKGLVTMLILFFAWLGESRLGFFEQNHLIMVAMMLVGSITRFLAPLLMGSFLLFSTQVEEMISSFERMNVPQQIIIPFAAMYRFFPTAKEESKAIGNAMKMRGITLAFGIKHPIAFIEYRLIPLINSLVKIANDLTISCVTRGLGNTKKRSSVIELAFNYADGVFLSLALGLSIGYYLG